MLVFDGHGRATVSRYLAANFPRLVKDGLTTLQLDPARSVCLSQVHA